MPIIKCRICNKLFYARPSHIKRGDCKYCSNQCAYKGRLKGKFVKCAICGKSIWRTPRHFNHSKSNKFFCDKSCQTLWRNSVMYIGSNHPNWKGGVYAYKDILIRKGIRRICRRCSVRDSRILTVHHIDLNHNNNGSGNLTWLCYNCHFLIHKDKQEREKFMEVLV